MSQQEILVVDDDRALLETVKANLAMERFAVRTAASVPEAIERLRHPPHPDAMILDISLEPELPRRGTRRTMPDDGLALLRWLRRETDFPVIMLSGTNAESVKVLALDLGADDYVTKPFNAQELAARVRAVLRRVTPVTEDILRFRSHRPNEGGQVMLEIDPSRHTVRVGGEPVGLTQTEFGILNALAQAHGRVLSRAQLLDGVFGTEHWGAERTVDVHVRRLREKLELDPGKPEIVLTVRGVGYRFGLTGD